MTKSLPFTANAIVRAVYGARKAGIKVAAVRVEPDGSIIVLDEALAPVVVPKQDPEKAALSKWDV